MEMISKMMESQVNSVKGTTVEDELKRLSSNIIEFANAKLQKPTLENEKLVAEIGLLLNNAAQSNAMTRKINAEAESIELDNFSKKLRIAFGAAKVIATMDGNPEAILFCKNMEALVAQFNSQVSLERGEI
ncbi:hypothetical protein [Pedobacter sp. UC225_65]|uniref:hypothetical protein n=1 Tax=Pedobacter sp. UC225_65 TaxID=3350173 RepID=UPI00366CE431